MCEEFKKFIIENRIAIAVDGLIYIEADELAEDGVSNEVTAVTEEPKTEENFIDRVVKESNKPKKKKRKPKMSDETREAVERDIIEGLGANEIVEKYDVGIATVYRLGSEQNKRIKEAGGPDFEKSDYEPTTDTFNCASCNKSHESKEIADSCCNKKTEPPQRSGSGFTNFKKATRISNEDWQADYEAKWGHTRHDKCSKCDDTKYYPNMQEDNGMCVKCYKQSVE